MSNFTHKQIDAMNKELGYSAPLRRAVSDVTTLRNRNLITDKEQKKLAATVVGFFGLSVGSHAAITWIMLSRATHIKIADPDIIAPSNLNRLRFGWDSVGKKKVNVVRQLLRRVHPFILVNMSTKTSSTAMTIFCMTRPKVHVIIDEIDDLSGKLALRRIARSLRIPLISAVDVGDNVIVDVERYDLKPQPKLFLGRLQGIERKDVSKMTKEEQIRTIITLVGLSHNEPKMLKSLMDLGNGIQTWPQLGSTATMAGGVIAMLIKRVVLGEKIRSGRYVVDMDAVFRQKRENLTLLRNRVRTKYDIPVVLL